MISSDVLFLFLYKIKSNQVKCSELQNLFPIHNSNYILRNRLPFYPEIPCSRHSEENPIFKLSQCYINLSQQLENPLDFSLSINRAVILLKKLTLIYE